MSVSLPLSSILCPRPRRARARTRTRTSAPAARHAAPTSQQLFLVPPPLPATIYPHTEADCVRALLRTVEYTTVQNSNRTYEYNIDAETPFWRERCRPAGRHSASASACSNVSSRVRARNAAARVRVRTRTHTHPTSRTPISYTYTQYSTVHYSI